jgi:curved DNA-binding protein CbpA
MWFDLSVPDKTCGWCFTADDKCGQFREQMKDAFQRMGMAPCLVLADDSLREAFLEASKRAHPDAGGGEGEFAALREAMTVLSSPASRLKLWMELRGTPTVVRGVIDTALMDVFAEVGRVTQGAESLIRKREEAKSALGRAMLEGETQLRREEVEKMIGKVDELIRAECRAFSAFEVGESLDQEAASVAARNLTFLEKWHTGLRGCYSRLV